MPKGVCSECGITSNNIHVHHKDRKHKNNEKSNLVRLCPDCHGKEHGYEGSYLSERVFDAVDDMTNPKRLDCRLYSGFAMLSEDQE